VIKKYGVRPLASRLFFFHTTWNVSPKIPASLANLAFTHPSSITSWGENFNCSCFGIAQKYTHSPKFHQTSRCDSPLHRFFIQIPLDFRNFVFMKEVVVSGIRPTGKLHLGNYFGAFKNFLKLQEQFDSYFFIADYHSLTTHPTPGDLSASVKRVLAEYIALGLDPEKCTIYFQSDVPETAELYLFLNMNAYLGELERVTSFKEKARTQPNNINAGLLTYPVLMAADILLHRGVKVPVGKDQEQHLEMARTFANRFNRLYNTEYFPEPQAFSFEQNLVKVPGLTGTGKMSKSAGEADTIYLDEDAASLNKKIMRAVSDSGPSEPGSPKSTPVQNLFDLMGLVSNVDTIQFFEESHKAGNIRYGDLKKQLAADMETFIAPLRDKIQITMGNEKMLNEIAQLGAEKARLSARKTLREVREIIGFGNR
jgi:tryptophanyl-tRNA synthetase